MVPRRFCHRYDSTPFHHFLWEAFNVTSLPVFGNTGNLVFRRHIYDDIDKGVSVKMDVKPFIFSQAWHYFQGEVSLVTKLYLLLGQVSSRCSLRLMIIELPNPQWGLLSAILLKIITSVHQSSLNKCTRRIVLTHTIWNRQRGICTYVTISRNRSRGQCIVLFYSFVQSLLSFAVIYKLLLDSLINLYHRWHWRVACTLYL